MYLLVRLCCMHSATVLLHCMHSLSDGPDNSQSDAGAEPMAGRHQHHRSDWVLSPRLCRRGLLSRQRRRRSSRGLAQVHGAAQATARCALTDMAFRQPACPPAPPRCRSSPPPPPPLGRPLADAAAQGRAPMTCDNLVAAEMEAAFLFTAT